MCRNIRTLHNFQPPATEDEIRAAALQYVRKVSGSTKPSKANAEVFEEAVEQLPRDLRDRVDRVIERLGVRLRRLGRTAHLAHVLKR